MANLIAACVIGSVGIGVFLVTVSNFTKKANFTGK
jgi:hypothetical protein